MIANFEEYKKDFLEYQLWCAKYFLGATPFIFICSDDESIRNYFTLEMSKIINSITDYSLDFSGQHPLVEKLKSNHLLLLNFNEKVLEYKKIIEEEEIKKFGKVFENEEGYAEAYGLIRFRDYFTKVNFHTIVVISDFGIHRRISSCLHDLSSVSKFMLIDTYLKDEEFTVNDVKIFKKIKGVYYENK